MTSTPLTITPDCQQILDTYIHPLFNIRHPIDNTLVHRTDPQRVAWLYWWIFGQDNDSTHQHMRWSFLRHAWTHSSFQPFVTIKEAETKAPAHGFIIRLSSTWPGYITITHAGHHYRMCVTTDITINDISHQYTINHYHNTRNIALPLAYMMPSD
jgi:hypothetical protein